MKMDIEPDYKGLRVESEKVKNVDWSFMMLNYKVEKEHHIQRIRRFITLE